jgi:hypothetical protein
VTAVVNIESKNRKWVTLVNIIVIETTGTNFTILDYTRVVPEVPDLTKKKKHFGKKMSLFLYIVSF